MILQILLELQQSLEINFNWRKVTVMIFVGVPKKMNGKLKQGTPQLFGYPKFWSRHMALT